MKESYGEGVATHTGPESCAVAREGGGEALTGGRAGRVLSREIHDPRRKPWALRGADAVEEGGRPHLPCRHRETRRDPARSETLCTHGNISHGNREIPRSSAGRGSWQTASGSPRTHADDGRTREVGQLRSTGEAAEQSRTHRRRRRWREGGWPRETRLSATRPGLRAGQARQARSSGYGKQRNGTGNSGSPRSCTTSTTSSVCGRRTSR